MSRIVFAYSGRPAASAAISWLKERYAAEVVTVTVDLGSGIGREDVRDRAVASGAARAHVLDLREDFARDCILPSLKAGALADGRCPMISELGRPVVARALVEIARIEGTVTVACGGGALHDDPVPFAQAVRSLQSDLQVLIPEREWTAAGLDPTAFAAVAGDGVAALPGVPGCAVRSNIWGQSLTSANRPKTTASLLPAGRSRRRPARAAHVQISFERGVPVAINDVGMPLVDLIDSLAAIAGAHGVGKVERDGGGVVIDAPAAVVLHAAHACLQERVTAEELHRLAHHVGRQYVDVINDGAWFTSRRDALDTFVEKLQERVNGVVRLELFNGVCQVVDAVQCSHVSEATHAESEAPVGSGADDPVIELGRSLAAQ